MYGKFVPGVSHYGNRYGFVNENQVRVGAGISLFIAFVAFLALTFFANYFLALFLVGILWLDFFIKVFFDPKYSIFGNIAKIFVKETFWVGAMQKRFAWSIGLVISTINVFCLLLISGLLAKYNILLEMFKNHQEAYIPPFMAVSFSLPIFLCLLCIVFMFLEAFFGYCVGCKIYAKLVKLGFMKRVENQNCAGNACKLS